MKKTTRFFALLLCACLLCSALPTAWAAEHSIIARGADDGSTTWTLTDDGTLTISGNGPITDTIEEETDPDGSVYTITLDCIGWQIAAAFEEQAQGLSKAETERARFDFVKTLVVEEGVTAIPDNEFDAFYPRTIVLPASMQRVGGSAINANFAESLTVNGKDTTVAGGLRIATWHKGQTPFASLDEAIDAYIAAEVELDKISMKDRLVNDLATAYAVRDSLTDEMTAPEYLAYFNETYGTDFTEPEECIRFALNALNRDFGTSYTRVEDVLTYVQDEFGGSFERDAALSEKFAELYAKVEISPRLDTIALGEENVEDQNAYQWLTVYAPSGSKAQEAAKCNSLPFRSTQEEQEEKEPTFFERMQQFFAGLKSKIETMFAMFRLSLSRLDLLHLC